MKQQEAINLRKDIENILDIAYNKKETVEVLLVAIGRYKVSLLSQIREKVEGIKKQKIAFDGGKREVYISLSDVLQVIDTVGKEGK